MRPASLLVLLLASAPFALAHDPPRPVTSCQAGGEATHDYLPPAEGTVFAGADGNLADCDGDLAERDFDGEPDHGLGGVLLLVESGGGATSGTLACHGGAGHHGRTVHVDDVRGTGPAFLLVADVSAMPGGTAPDCGDGYLNPCLPPPPCRCTPLPFPFNVIVDQVNAALREVSDLVYEPCTPGDGYHRVEAAPGPRSLVAPFDPGADGAYHVFILDGYDAPPAGHVWTS